MTAQGTFELQSGKFTRKVRAIALSGGLPLAINFGCTDRLPVEAAFDVLDTPMTVTRADPAEGEQGETIEVRVFGTGFEDDAVPTWQRNGVADIEIHVIRSDFVSSTELRAVISIAPNAEIGIRDIAVSSDRKKGIGSENPTAVGRELFAVREYVAQGLGFFSQGLWSGTGSFAMGINNDGVIAGVGSGQLDDGSGRMVAVYWTAVSGMVGILDASSVTAGINNRGWIVGNSDAGGFVFEDGVVIHLERHGPYQVYPMAINDSGTIVGVARDEAWIAPNKGPVVLRRVPPFIPGVRADTYGSYGSPIPLPVPDGDDIALLPRSINNNGDIVGTLFHTGGSPQFRAVLWKARPNGTYEDPLLLAGGFGGAADINDAGWIVGDLSAGHFTAAEGTQSKAVLWHPDDYSNPILLQGAGGVQTHASAINNHGQIAGERRDGCCNAYNGVLWEVDPKGRTISTTLLPPTQGHATVRVHGINDAGWVVGTSTRSYPGGDEATLWRPK